MITKREILAAASQLGLNPHIVEKDYALGWLLAGISAHDELSESWVFKGGTCLKKCFFETYRFSEDLDFTLRDESHVDEEFLKKVFSEIGEWVYEQSGLEVPADRQDFDIYRNSRGKLNCQGRISYRGPVSPHVGGMPRIKLDLTADECIVLPPVRTPIYHPYSDAPDDGITVVAYAYEEAFAEKVRALRERTRPRDLYDVVNLHRNADEQPAAAVLRDVLTRKCEYKGIAVPRMTDLEPHRAELEGAWDGMLKHQLPALPPAASFWEALPAFFAWLHGVAAPAAPASYAGGAGETVLRERTLRLPVRGQALSYIEIIRFAAANRLCVDLDYQGSTRRIEPYSLRRTREGNIILHAWNTHRDQHRSYRVDRIQGARVADVPFTPRYAVELTPSGPVSIPPTQRASDSSGRAEGLGRSTFSDIAPPRDRARRAPSKPRKSRSFGFGLSSGPTYIYQCGMCGKKFRRKTMNGRLNRHKAPGGFPCPGGIGLLVETKY